MTFLESSSRSSLLVEHDLFRKPVPTFRDHALRVLRLAPVAASARYAPALRFERVAPLLLDHPCLVERQRREGRELVDPGKWPTGVDDRLRMRGDAFLLVARRNARVQRRAPGAADDVDLLGWLATGCN